MYDNSYTKYLKDIATCDTLSPKEEITYFEMYNKTKSEHDIASSKLIRDKIVAANMRLVLKIALSYKNSSVDMSDIITAGATGLVKAVENFDVSRGNRFITYALYWIKSYIHTGIESHKNMIAIPWNQTVAIMSAKKKCKGNQEINNDLKFIDSLNKNKVAIDSPVNGDSKNTFADVIADENGVETSYNNDASLLINALTSCLPDNEKQVLYETYGINSDKPHSLREIGNSMGFSHSRIKQLRDQAMRRIKKYTSKEMLQLCKDKAVEL